MNEIKLHPDSTIFLNKFYKRAEKELHGRRLCDLDINEARNVIGKLLAPNDDEATAVSMPKLNVAVGESTIKYEHNKETVTLPIKIYAPRDHDHELPVMMYFHGGGFALGDAGLIDFGCQYLAEHLPCRVVSVDYRKSPEFKFPTAHNDAYLSTLYVSEHPEEFKSNGIIYVGGDSAGGNLATSVCHIAKMEQKFNVSFQLLIYPWVNLNNNSPSNESLAHGFYLELETLNWMSRLYANTEDDKNNPLASPLMREDFSELPPALVVIGTADPIYDDAIAYYEELKRAGVEAQLMELDGILHDFCALPTFYHQVFDVFALATRQIKAATSDVTQE